MSEEMRLQRNSLTSGCSLGWREIIGAGRLRSQETGIKRGKPAEGPAGGGQELPGTALSCIRLSLSRTGTPHSTIALRALPHHV